MKESHEKLSRRRLFAGAGAVGAAAAVAAILPVRPDPGVTAQALPPADGERKGYQLTEHIRRYYATARV